MSKIINETATYYSCLEHGEDLDFPISSLRFLLSLCLFVFNMKTKRPAEIYSAGFFMLITMLIYNHIVSLYQV